MAILVTMTPCSLEVPLRSGDARFPARGHGRDPLARRGKLFGVEPVAHLAAVALFRDQSRVPEDAEMLRDGLPAHRQALRELRRGGGSRGQPTHQLAARGIREGYENVLLHVQPNGCTFVGAASSAERLA